jgi:hypothetical protein
MTDYIFFMCFGYLIGGLPLACVFGIFVAIAKVLRKWG